MTLEYCSNPFPISENALLSLCGIVEIQFRTAKGKKNTRGGGSRMAEFMTLPYEV